MPSAASPTWSIRREPQLLAGIVSDLRVVNGQRGKVAIFKLDDGSEYVEAVANEDLLEANRERLRDDELVIVQGKVQPDRFSGGLRLNVNQLWDLPAARGRRRLRQTSRAPCNPHPPRPRHSQPHCGSAPRRPPTCPTGR